MGKVTKSEKGKPKIFQFDDKKRVTVNIDGNTVIIQEIDSMDIDVGIVASKDISLYDPTIEILTKSPTLQEAKWKLKGLLAAGEVVGGSNQNKPAAAPAIQLAPKDGTMKHFETFKKMTDAFFASLTEQPVDCTFDVAKDAIKEAACVYADKGNHSHETVKTFMLSVNCQHPFREGKDRFWIFQSMYLRLEHFKGASEGQDDLKEEYRNWVKELRAALGANFYRPTDYPNDLESAEELLDAADACIRMGKVDKAIHTTEEALLAAANCLDAYYRLAEYHLYNRDFAAALEAMERVEKMPMAEKFLANRTEYFILLGNLCKRIPDKTVGDQHLEQLKALAQKYQIPIDQIAA